MANDVLAEVGRLRLVLVVAVRDALDAPALADALVEGGIPCAEIARLAGEAVEIAQKARADSHPLALTRRAGRVACGGTLEARRFSGKVLVSWTSASTIGWRSSRGPRAA